MGEKYQFTDEQINYIISNWGKESPHSMKNKFGCTWYAVCGVAKSHGLEIPTSNNWTEEEIKKLKELSKKYHYGKIAEIMDKSKEAVYLKAKRLGITLIQDRREWTKEEETLLTELWGNKPIEYIAKKLKRTVISLKVKAERMELGPMIENNSYFITVSDISEIFNVTRDRVTITWVKLGLNLTQIKLTQNRTYYGVTLKDLLLFLETNQNEWDSRNLEKNILGIEPEWLKQKRERDIIENPLWYRKWTVLEVIRAGELLEEGKDYKEIASILNRTECAVAYMLRDAGHSYKVKHYWTEEQLKFLKDNYSKMTYENIGKSIGRTTKAVGAKAEELGYKKRLIKSKQGSEKKDD